MSAIAAPITFLWLGMVLAISFVEAPLKFSAPGVTIQVGLGIGRLVFRALNAIEMVLAATLISLLFLQPPATTALCGIGTAVTILAIQVAAVRPALRRRSDAVLAATEEPAGGIIDRSRAHYVYAGLEVAKVAALLTGGVVLQAALPLG